MAKLIFYAPPPSPWPYHSQKRSLSNYPKINLTCDCRGNSVGKRCVRKSYIFTNPLLFSFDLLAPIVLCVKFNYPLFVLHYVLRFITTREEFMPGHFERKSIYIDGFVPGHFGHRPSLITPHFRMFLNYEFHFPLLLL